MTFIPTYDTPKLAYLRNRPFLIIEVFVNPAATKSHDRTRTEKKGWMKNENNIVLEENPILVDRVRDKHLFGASVIIDLLQDIVLKNRLDDSDAEVLAHYKQKYASMIGRQMNTWTQKTAAQMGDFESFRRSHKKGDSGGERGSQTAPAVARAISRKV